MHETPGGMAALSWCRSCSWKSRPHEDTAWLSSHISCLLEGQWKVYTPHPQPRTTIFSYYCHGGTGVSSLLDRELWGKRLGLHYLCTPSIAQCLDQSKPSVNTSRRKEMKERKNKGKERKEKRKGISYWNNRGQLSLVVRKSLAELILQPANLCLPSPLPPASDTATKLFILRNAVLVS